MTTENVGHSPRTIVVTEASVMSLADVVNGPVVVVVVYHMVRREVHFTGNGTYA